MELVQGISPRMINSERASAELQIQQNGKKSTASGGITEFCYSLRSSLASLIAKLFSFFFFLIKNRQMADY